MSYNLLLFRRNKKYKNISKVLKKVKKMIKKILIFGVLGWPNKGENKSYYFIELRRIKKEFTLSGSQDSAKFSSALGFKNVYSHHYPFQYLFRKIRFFFVLTENKLRSFREKCTYNLSPINLATKWDIVNYNINKKVIAKNNRKICL